MPSKLDREISAKRRKIEERYAIFKEFNGEVTVNCLGIIQITQPKGIGKHVCFVSTDTDKLFLSFTGGWYADLQEARAFESELKIAISILEKIQKEKK